MKEKQKTKSDDISEEFAKIEESKQQKMLESEKKSEPSLLSEYQAIKTGRIKDVEVKNGFRGDKTKIKLWIECEDGIETHSIQNTGEYSQSNPFVRFVEWYDIGTREPSKLLDAKVKFIKRRKTWKLYIPKSLDKFTTTRHHINMLASRIGFTNFWKFNLGDMIIGGGLFLGLVSLFSLPIASQLLQSGILQSGLLAYTLVTLAILIATIFIFRMHTVVKDRVSRQKDQDKIVR